MNLFDGRGALVHVQALSIGGEFRRVLASGCFQGEVHSVFDRVINLLLDVPSASDSLFSLGASGVDRSIAMAMVALGGAWTQLALKGGDPVLWADGLLTLGDSVLVDGLLFASVWYPFLPAWPSAQALDALALSARFRAAFAFIDSAGVSTALGGKLPSLPFDALLDGSSRFVDIFVSRFHQGALALIDWASTTSRAGVCVRSPREETLRLLGLGPGLTPSGDDFLAGFLVGCNIVSRWLDASPFVAVALGEVVRELMPARTGRLSCHFLAYAANGSYGEATGDLLRALSFPPPTQGIDPLFPAAARLASIGASSGRDQMLGIAAAMLALTDKAI